MSKFTGLSPVITPQLLYLSANLAAGGHSARSADRAAMDLTLLELAEVFDGDSDDGKVSQASREEKTGAVRDLEFQQTHATAQNGHLEPHQRAPSLGAPLDVVMERTPTQNVDASLAGPSTGSVGGHVPEFVQRLLAQELKEWTLAQGKLLRKDVQGDIGIALQDYAARLEVLANLPCRTDDSSAGQSAGGAAAVGVEDDDDANLAAHTLCNSLGRPGWVAPGAERAETRRTEWTSAEDELICSSVQRLGSKKWRAIAAQLPGRSDDAVRNRWSRLQQSAQLGMFSCSKGCGRNFADGPECASHEKTCHVAVRKHSYIPVAVRKQASEQGEQQTAAQNSEYIRKAWTRAEDGIIMQSVAELGHKWFAIGRRLPGRHCGV